MTQSHSEAKKHSLSTWLRHPVATALITFLFTGVGASLFSNWLDSNSKKRDLEIAASRRAIDSVKSVTDLIFERDTRANFVVSTLQRHSSIEELRERKKAYDDVFVRYNATIQSNLFRIREIFHTANYTDFERLLEGPLRDLFMAEDQCLTSAYDVANAKDGAIALRSITDASNDTITHCAAKEPDQTVSFKSIHQAILHCEYTYSDALFRVVEQSEKNPSIIAATEGEIRSACQFPRDYTTTKPNDMEARK